MDPLLNSPCIKVCKLDEAGDYIGCGRNNLEIRQWPWATDEEKRVILLSAEKRLSAAE